MSGSLVREVPYFKNARVQALDDVLMLLQLRGDAAVSLLALRLRLRLDRDHRVAEKLSNEQVAEIARAALQLVPDRAGWLREFSALRELIQ